MSTGEAARCWSCGAELSPDSTAQGMCAQCLLNLGLSSTNIPFAEPEAPPEESSPVQKRPNRRLIGPASVGLLLALVVFTIGFFFVRRQSPPDQRVFRFNLVVPAGSEFAISPDGRRIAFTAPNEQGKTVLNVHLLDAFHNITLPETEDAAGPFWSPDSRWIGFYAHGKLRRVDAQGGGSEIITDAPTGKSATWGVNGAIVFERNATDVLYRVSDRGGTPEPVTQSDSSRRGYHRWPHFLPDGRHFIYTTVSNTADTEGVYVSSIDSHDSRLIFNGRANAMYGNGSLLFVRAGLLLAQPFDERRLSVSGEAHPLRFAEQVGRFSNSSNGILVYGTSEPPRPMRLMWYDRSGKGIQNVEALSTNGKFSLSPDGRSLAVTNARDIWISDLERGATSRFTFNAADNDFPLWSPDGTRLVFTSSPNGRKALYQKPINAGTNEELFVEVPMLRSIESWSMDGRLIAFTTEGDRGKTAIGILTVNEHRPTLIQSAFSLRSPSFSPDGRWLAYVSDETGRDEVYVASFPGQESKWQISVDGATTPKWRGDGRELFYMSPMQILMSVNIGNSGPALNVSAPHELFRMPAGSLYQASADGQRFLVSSPEVETTAVPINVIVNWPAELNGH